jgi:hypothetical protein
MSESHRQLSVFLVVVICLMGSLGCGERGLPEAEPEGWAGALDRPSRYPSAERIVAIGDLHGDLAAARGALRLAGAIGDDDRWIGGDLVLVQTGDILDRGDDAVEILDLFDGLSGQAGAAGGEIHLLNGNHELMNVKLDMRYVSVGGYLDFLPGEKRDPATATAQDVVDGVAERILAIRPGGQLARSFAERNVITTVGDTVFVHGGVLPHLVDYGVERLNQETREWARGDLRCPPEPLFESDGPLWSRHYSDEPDEVDCRLLGDTLQSLGAKRMVVGHTVQGDGISEACGGLVWRIDVGMAEHYGGSVEVLDLSGCEIRVLESPGPAD